MKWTDENIMQGIAAIAEQFEPKRMPTNREVINASGGYALSNAIQKHGGYEYWAKRMGLKQVRSDTKMGIECERKVASILRDAGHNVEETSVKYPYDLLVDDCVKIDVKTANESSVHGYPVYSYRIAKPQQTCDFYICCEKSEKENMFVIPAHICKGQKQIVMGRETEKYSYYRNAFFLIDDTVNHYKSLAIPF